MSDQVSNRSSDGDESPFAIAWDSQFANAVAQVRAKAALVELLGPDDEEIESINWRYRPLTLVRNAAALHQRLVVSAREGERFDPLDEDTARAALTAARAWEGIAGLEEHARQAVALMTAAVDYELAGYQANASCLARRAQRGTRATQRVPLLQIVGSFIERRFVLLRELESATSEAPHLSDDGDVDAHEVRIAAATALAARGLAALGAYFLSGDTGRRHSASELLDMALRGFLESAAAPEASMIAGVRSLLPVMTARSTWERLAPVAPGAPRWQRYVKALARGGGPSIRTARSVSELWPSQLRALENGLLDETRNKVIRMPTSAGKTRVAEMAMVHELVSRPDSRCLYIAPYRALASEVERALDELLGELGFAASAVLGGSEDAGVEDVVAADDHVLICTPEKADLLLRVRPDLLGAVRVVVLDEGQVIADASRGIGYDLLVTRLRRRLPNARFLFLSAVVPEETLEDFAHWLHAGADDIITSQWRPAVQRLARFEWRGSRGTLRFVGGEQESDLAQFLPGIVTERTFEYLNEATGRINRRRFPDSNNKAQLAAALAYEFVRTGPVLVFCPQTNLAESSARALLRRLELARLAGETHHDLTHPNAVAADVAAEWLGDDHVATTLLRGVHHGRLPEAVRQAVEEDVRAERIRVLAATTTLAQGVNLPVRTVIIHSVWRSDSEGHRERITAREYWNIAGRAGRAVHETDGLIVHLTTSDLDDQDFRAFAEARDNVELVFGATSRLLRDLMHERISSEQAADELDPELLAMLVEEGTEDPEELRQRIAATISESFGAAQAQIRDVSFEPLTQAAVSGVSAIISQTPSWERLRVFARTGLSSRSCRYLASVIDETPELGSLIAHGEDVGGLLAGVLEPILRVPEMQPQASYGGSYYQLLLSWVTGLRIPDIVFELGVEGGTPEEIGRFLEEFAGFRLPWGISALNQIAAASNDVRQLSTGASALPGMVKYGVPTPASAWLMGLGIRSRGLAIDLAGQASTEIGAPSPGALRAWLAVQDPALLGRAVHATGGRLTNLSEVVRRSRRTRIGERIDEGSVLPLETTAEFASGGSATEAISNLEVPSRVHLRRDYGSTLDRNLIDVQAAGVHLGVLDSEASDLLALEIDTGSVLTATVTAIERADDRRRLHLRIDVEG